jgi:hypothetical protein
MDNLTTAMLDTMSASDLDALPPSVLADLDWQLLEEDTVNKRRRKALFDAFERRYAAKASSALQADGRDTGTVRLHDGSYEVAVTRPKRVKWAQPKLRAALDALPQEVAAYLATVEIKIDERRFDALMQHHKALLMDARTVETGKATYALSERVAA